MFSDTTERTTQQQGKITKRVLRKSDRQQRSEIILILMK